MKKIAFICVHNSCRSQIAQALGKIIGKGKFEFYYARTELKNSINNDAVRLMKKLYNVDISLSQKPKLIKDIPQCDIYISMGCNVKCPIIKGSINYN